MEKNLIKHEISHKDLTDPKWFGSFIPNLYLKSWGFDLNKEISYWYDEFRNCMVLVQRKDEHDNASRSDES